MNKYIDDNKKIHFVTGLPRSGSTLLCNLLVQNPRFHSSSTSSLLTLLLAMRERWSELNQIKSSNDTTAGIRLLRGIFYSFFSNTDKPVCFDKGRGWPRHVEMAEEILGHNAKMIVTVRDLREVLASFETLWRQNSGHRAIPQERARYDDFNTIEGRLSVWMDNKQVVGAAYNAIRDAVHRGFSDRLLFVDFDTLTRNPERVMKKVYEFIDEPYFEHDFNHVEQVIQEKDEYYGFDDLHTIRPKIEPVTSKWEEVLGKKAGNFYQHLSFWSSPDVVSGNNINIV